MAIVTKQRDVDPGGPRPPIPQVLRSELTPYDHTSYFSHKMLARLCSALFLVVRRATLVVAFGCLFQNFVRWRVKIVLCHSMNAGGGDAQTL